MVMMIMVVYGLQPTLLSVTTAARGVHFHRARILRFGLCRRLCGQKRRLQPTLQSEGGKKRRVIAAQSGYCVLYQEDKPIRGTLIDINFHSLHLSSLSGPFSFNGRIHSDDL